MGTPENLPATERAAVREAGFDIDAGQLTQLSNLNSKLKPLGHVYCGMGHYAVLVRAVGPAPPCEEPAYGIAHMGGSNDWEREDRRSYYREMVVPLGRLLTLAAFKEKMQKYEYVEDRMALFGGGT